MKYLKGYSLITFLTLIASHQAIAADDLTNSIVNIELSPALISQISAALPESTVVNQEFLNLDYDPNITFAEDAQVGITFIDEGAGYKNSLGYFTFQAQTFDNMTFGDIDSDSSGRIDITELQNLDGVNTGMIFSNSSKSGAGGALNAGDTVSLTGSEITANGTGGYTLSDGDMFPEETKLGFFLMQNAWKNGEVQGWDNANDPITFYSVDFLNPENSATATIDNAAENSRHIAMMSTSEQGDQIILGFEDLVRPGGDNDFNDALFTVTGDPVSALFAQIPSAQQVIQLQAAPAIELGKTPWLIVLLLAIAYYRNRLLSNNTSLRQVVVYVK
ncbi:MAG: DUF4114 domain-containing protein [Oceanospirillaceae bacterium]|nr:DUF4114 domain-containing protein [Oceanospirillaceae bacterium]